MSQYSEEIQKRRTFAIISHPDAGKTTLTEKLLRYGGAVHTAGSVKARKSARHATSDWMSMEQERGISISTSVMHFVWAGCEMNLLDTPGHNNKVIGCITADTLPTHNYVCNKAVVCMTPTNHKMSANRVRLKYDIS